MNIEGRLLHIQIIGMRQSFFEEGLLSKEYEPFHESFHGEPKPNFAEKIMFIYFLKSLKMILEVDKILCDPALRVIDFVTLQTRLHQLVYCCCSVGAVKIGTLAHKILGLFSVGKFQEGRATFLQLRSEYKTLHGKLYNYFRLLNRLGVPNIPRMPVILASSTDGTKNKVILNHRSNPVPSPEQSKSDLSAEPTEQTL